jgi:hypothetical protein
LSTRSETAQHAEIKSDVASVCAELGYDTDIEARGKGWRADVLSTHRDRRFAFEIQVSSQSLKKTLERQARYARDGVECCWLFQKPIPKLAEERPDLPVFYVLSGPTGFLVSLSGRNEIALNEFVTEILAGNIRFSEVARAEPRQAIKLVFYEMECWSCKEMNHIYYVEPDYRSSCNAVIEPKESLWASDQQEYRPEIIEAARGIIGTDRGVHLRLGDIKPRFSKTVDHEYISFGCFKCDSLFGDYPVREAKMEAVFGYGQVDTFHATIDLQTGLSLPLPHWCYPLDGRFCDSQEAL